MSVVPHTHWDREWYSPFQTFRLRLVTLLDEFLPFLEHDESYRHFLLDGQTAVVDDYLEIRPDAEGRIRSLAAEGRLSLGPWMILMDEFMVSAETTVRNLQAGMRRADELGSPMPVGYLPDMFGHVAQMPQILRLAGLEHAVVWRGVPAAIRATGFHWEAPDGSRVRAEYLYGSYSNGRDLPREPEQLVERARGYESELGDARLDGMLLMNGTDHQTPQTWLGDVVARANADQDDFHFEITSLADHLARQPTEGLLEWRGELRSGARSNILMGVASNRVDVHQACSLAERTLERMAEPMAALSLPAAAYPAELLDTAWRQLILNSAHDSSCACSDDEVVDQVLVRYREARQIAHGLGRDAVRRLAADVEASPGASVIVNTTSRSRGGLVEVPVPGRGPVHFRDDEGRLVAGQVVDEETGERFGAHVVGSKLGWVLDMLRGEEFAGAPVRDYTIRETDSHHEVVVEGAGPGEPRRDVGDLREQLLDLAASAEAEGDKAAFLIRMLHAPRRRALVATEAVPGFGWRTYEALDGHLDAEPRVTADATGLRNEHLEVEVDESDGTFAITGPDGVRTPGLNRYVDGGDGGDTYNWSPPTDDLIVEEPERVEVNTVETGPLRGRLQVISRYRWPSAAEGNERSCTARSDRTVEVDVVTTLELRAGEPFVRVATEFDNRCRDHRLRAHFPLPRPVSGSDAECAFAVVHRGLEAEGGPNEFGLPTFPSRRFVDVSDGESGLALIHDGLLEYEVVDGRELALTLLRSVGYLSRLEPQLRPNPAGPPVVTEGAQMPGRQRLEYSVMVHEGDWQDADLYRRADEALVPLEAAPAAGADRRPLAGELLRIEGAEVSAVHRQEGALVVRLFNPTGEPTSARVAIPGDGGLMAASGDVIDLRGRPVEPFEGSTKVGPGAIVTLRLP